MIMGTLILVLTIISAIIIFTVKGWDKIVDRPHSKIGFTIVVVAGAIAAGGYASLYLLNTLKWQSYLARWLKTVHKVSYFNHHNQLLKYSILPMQLSSLVRLLLSLAQMITLDLRMDHGVP